MKKKILAFAMAAATLCGCGTTGTQTGAAILGQVLGNVTGQQTGADAVAGVLGSILGASTTPTKEQLIGTWTYYQPGCAFTSENLLAQAGGEVVATQIKEQMLPTFQKIGVSSANTSITFTKEGTYNASFAGKAFSGSYTYDEATQRVTLQALLLNINCYAKRNTNGISLLFESSKLLTLLQTLSAMSGNAQVGTIGELSKNYNGLRMGFDFK